MNIEVNNKTATKYIVYWDDMDGAFSGSLFDDLAIARAAASRYALNNPGQEFHVAAHMVTFRAETVVKEV